MVNFWQGKKVFITGHTGFKGSWLALWLQHQQAYVTGFSLDLPTPVNFFTEADVAQDMIDQRGDIRNQEQLVHALEECQPDIIFHLAAQSLVRSSYYFPVETYATNVMGTVHLLEAARHCESVRVVINVTSDKCYDNQEEHKGYKETDPLGGYDPYSSSKACAELVTGAYRNSYLRESKIGLASVRAGNVIGGGDWAKDRLIPDLVAACLEKRSLKIRYPQAVRPWQHVLEPLWGYLCLAEALYHEPSRYAEAWNFGPVESDVKTVAWIADTVLKQWGGALKWEREEGAHLHEAAYLKLDCSKAQAKLNWKPRWKLEKALEMTVAWYQAQQQGVKMRAFTLNQIDQYMKV